MLPGAASTQSLLARCATSGVCEGGPHRSKRRLRSSVEPPPALVIHLYHVLFDDGMPGALREDGSSNGHAIWANEHAQEPEARHLGVDQKLSAVVRGSLEALPGRPGVRPARLVVCFAECLEPELQLVQLVVLRIGVARRVHWHPPEAIRVVEDGLHTTQPGIEEFRQGDAAEAERLLILLGTCHPMLSVTSGGTKLRVVDKLVVVVLAPLLHGRLARCCVYVQIEASSEGTAARLGDRTQAQPGTGRRLCRSSPRSDGHVQASSIRDA
mmetsp:Transcript_15996/g.32485  ORF Transcript_15996/g.32485 Transcript_15996/m.32485 type:complete len:269 (-) Transcript_15996:287-1093(-)